MKKPLPLCKIFTVLLLISAGYAYAQATTDIEEVQINGKRKYTFLYTNPTIEPPVEEIIAPTTIEFFDVVTHRFSANKNLKLIRSKSSVVAETDISKNIQELGENNNADYVVVPKLKFFKVGIGRYVFSSQVEVCLDLYNSEGKLLSSETYNTYKNDRRIFGSAENSIRKATQGAMKGLRKKFQLALNSGTEGSTVKKSFPAAEF